MSFADKTNSGILRFEKNANGQVTGALVTTNFLLYAKSLIADYGDQVSPPMKDLSPIPREEGTWFIDTEALDHLQQMSRWRKSNRPKTGMIGKLMNKF